MNKIGQFLNHLREFSRNEDDDKSSKKIGESRKKSQSNRSKESRGSDDDKKSSGWYPGKNLKAIYEKRIEKSDSVKRTKSSDDDYDDDDFEYVTSNESQRTKFGDDDDDRASNNSKGSEEIRSYKKHLGTLVRDIGKDLKLKGDDDDDDDKLSKEEKKFGNIKNLSDEEIASFRAEIAEAREEYYRLSASDDIEDIHLESLDRKASKKFKHLDEFDKMLAAENAKREQELNIDLGIIEDPDQVGLINDKEAPVVKEEVPVEEAEAEPVPVEAEAPADLVEPVETVPAEGEAPVEEADLAKSEQPIDNISDVFDTQVDPIEENKDDVNLVEDLNLTSNHVFQLNSVGNSIISLLNYVEPFYDVDKLSDDLKDVVHNRTDSLLKEFGGIMMEMNPEANGVIDAIDKFVEENPDKAKAFMDYSLVMTPLDMATTAVGIFDLKKDGFDDYAKEDSEVLFNDMKDFYQHLKNLNELTDTQKAA